MTRRDRMRAYKRGGGAALIVIGVALWVISATLRLTALDHRDVSIGHIEYRLIGVVSGGALVAAGVILLATAV